MGDLTCMEYLIHCASNNRQDHITQDILLNASNEFRNIWNLVKKLQSVARIDVNKITRFLDNVQEGLERKKWETASKHSVYAEHEYRQIKKYIRPSYLDDYKVAKLIDNATSHGKSHPQKDTSVHQRRKQTFRNMQINKQRSIKIEKQVSVDSQDNKSSQNTKTHRQTNGDAREIGEGKEAANTEDVKNTAGKPKDIVTGNDSSAQDYTLNTYVENRPHESNVVRMLEENIKKNDGHPDQEINKERAKGGQFKNTNNGYDDYQVDTVIDSKQIAKERVKLGKDIGHRSDQSCAVKNPDQLHSSIDVSGLDKMNKKDSDTGEGDNGEKTKIKEQTMDNLHKSVYNNGKENESIQSQSLGDMAGPPTDGSMTLSKQNDSETSHILEAKDECSNKAIDDENKTDTGAFSKDVDITDQISDRVTRVSVECNTDEIVEKHAVVFEQDWDKSFKTLTSCEPSNGLKNSISFLGEVLKVSTEKVKKDVERMLMTGEGLIIDINEKLRHQKKIFFGAQLRNLQDEFSIMNNTSDDADTISTYAAKCVELAWFMSIQDPPLVFDYDSRPMLLEDLFQLFKPYKNKGKFVQYVVWPAIRRHGTGEIIARGIAEFR